MKLHNSELISALVDGELKGLRLWRVKRHIGRCAPCAGEYRRIQRVREMLAAGAVPPVMSDSPEFFWSKIKREIRNTTPARQSNWLVEHRFALAGAVSVLCVTIGIILVLPSRAPSHTASAPIIEAPVASVEHASTLIPDTVATSFEGTAADPAVIWVSGLPWTQDMTEMKTHFAQLGS